MYNPFFEKSAKDEQNKLSDENDEKRKCPYCGDLNSYKTLNCSKCFAYIYPEEEEEAKLVVIDDNRPYSPQAIVSFVLGITGILVCICYPLAIVNSIAAITIGIWSKMLIAKNGSSQKGDKFALWGIIFGSFAFVGSVLLAIADAVWKISSLYT